MSGDTFFYNYSQWRTEGLKEEDGILIGSDEHLEWAIPWWWENYSRFNSFPVAFADFGMSEAMRAWCRERGELIDLTFPGYVRGQQFAALFISYGQSDGASG